MIGRCSAGYIATTTTENLRLALSHSSSSTSARRVQTLDSGASRFQNDGYEIGSYREKATRIAVGPVDHNLVLVIARDHYFTFIALTILQYHGKSIGSSLGPLPS